jgi:hypothetical protein
MAKVKVKTKARIVFNPKETVITEVWKGIVTRRSGKYAHYCFAYDDLLIDETDTDLFKDCLCGMPNPKT